MAEVPPFTLPYKDWLFMVMNATGRLERALREDNGRPWEDERLVVQLLPESYMAVIPENMRRLVLRYARDTGEGPPTLEDVETLHRGFLHACLEIEFRH